MSSDEELSHHRKERATVVLGVTGGIACYKSCDLVNRLREQNFDVHVVMTREAKAFVSPLTFQALSGNRVFDELLEPVAGWDPVHTTLAEAADIVVVAPATANILGKVANGLCDDMVTCVIMATRAPVMFAAAMNDRMYQQPSVQRNVRTLSEWGYHLLPPVEGHLVCRKRGVGHLAEVEDIVLTVQRVLAQQLGA